MDSEQVTLVDSVKDVGRSTVKVPEFDNHLKKVGEHIGRNVVEVSIKMKTIIRNDKNRYIHIVFFTNI